MQTQIEKLSSCVASFNLCLFISNFSLLEVENPSGFEEGRSPSYTQRQPMVDPGALLLLTTCEI